VTARLRNRMALIMAVVAMMLATVAPIAARAASGPTAVRPVALQQAIPDWMTEDIASQFAIGMDVLVPFSLPEPFSGIPQYSASPGYYSLYWYVGGGSPTLLQIIGQDGGTIPDYSKYDRNVELTANASVNGNTAYRDLTPIYDLVYWQVGSVVYSVESQNSTVDSLTIANGLGVLSVPSAPEQTAPAASASVTSPDQIAGGDTGTVSVSTTDDAVLTADLGTFPATGSSSISVSGDVSVDWIAPVLDSDATATFTVSDAADGTVLASTPTLVTVPTGNGPSDQTDENGGPSDWSLTCPDIALAGDTVTVSAAGPGSATLSAADGSFAGGSPAVSVELGASVDIDFNVPDDGSESVLLTLSDASAAVATCSIAITTDAAAVSAADTAVPTELPDGSFPGDGTDLSVGTGHVPTVPADLGTATPAPTRDPALIEGDGTGIMEATRAVVPTVPPTATPTKTPKPGQPTDTPVPTETPAPTKTATPENPIPTLVPQDIGGGNLFALEIGPAGATMDCPFGVQLVVPKDTFADTTSVTVRPIPDNQLQLQQTVRFVPQSAFDIAFAKLDGRGTDLGGKSAEVHIDLKDRFVGGATLYELTNGQLTPIKNVSTKGTVLTFDVTGPLRIVAGVPVATTNAQKRSLVPLVVLALLAVIVLIVAITVLTSLRSGRTPTISNRGSRKRSRF
jgi:hypothetical protein